VALCVNAYLTGGHVASAEFVDRTFKEVQTLARDLDDPWGAAYIAQTHGLVLQLAGEPAPAVALLQAAADGHRHHGDLGALAHDLALLASAMSATGDPAVSAVLEECVSLTAMRDAGVADHVVAAWHGRDEYIMRKVYSHAQAEGLAAAGTALEWVFSGCSKVSV
jgi:hypothetical protein